MQIPYLAQIRNPVLPDVIGGGAKPDYTRGGTALGGLISNLVGALFIAGFLLSFVYLLVGGVGWITSGGDKTKLEQARNQITNAIIGIIVVGSAYALATLVAQFFGLDLKALPIPSVAPQPAGTSAQSALGSFLGAIGGLIFGN
jgi:hypothetical protein